MPEAQSNALIELGFWIASLVLGLISFCLGLGMIWDAQKGRRIARESTRWPSVVGRVIRSAVTEAPTNEGYSNFWLNFAYEYEVEGVRHESTAITGATVYQLGSQDHAEQILAPYPVGAQPYVFYNPRRPQDAVLQPGVEVASSGLNENVGCGMSMVIFGVLTILGTLFAYGHEKGWF